MRFLLPVVLSCALIPRVAAQLNVYSEFAKVDDKGNVTAPDRPREILSPALARNAFTSFQVVVQAEGDKSWWLHIGQNPENAVAVTMYREAGDRLEKTNLPIRGQGTQVFWMDLWTARTAPVERIKVEPQLNIDDDWVIYPMEARIMDAVVPDGQLASGVAAPMEVARGFLCGAARNAASPDSAAVSIPALRFRNAQQDLALAARAPSGDLQKLMGSCTGPLPANPEAYFPIRDYLFRLR
jgi:hypothetical protein